MRLFFGITGGNCNQDYKKEIDAPVATSVKILIYEHGLGSFKILFLIHSVNSSLAKIKGGKYNKFNLPLSHSISFYP